MDMPKFISEYEDVLQNIEASIIRVHHRINLLDYDVMEAMDALILYYKRIDQGREATLPELSEKPGMVIAELQSICEWRMGKESTFSGAGKLPPDSRLCTTAEILACLKRIQKSVNKWHKQYGRQGYLNFVGQYIK
jgi:hypothetical protein